MPNPARSRHRRLTVVWCHSVLLLQVFNHSELVFVDQARDSQQQEIQCNELDEHPGTIPAGRWALALLTSCSRTDSCDAAEYIDNTASMHACSSGLGALPPVSQQKQQVAKIYGHVTVEICRGVAASPIADYCQKIAEADDAVAVNIRKRHTSWREDGSEIKAGDQNLSDIIQGESKAKRAAELWRHKIVEIEHASALPQESTPAHAAATRDSDDLIGAIDRMGHGCLQTG